MLCVFVVVSCGLRVADRGVSSNVGRAETGTEEEKGLSCVLGRGDSSYFLAAKNKKTTEIKGLAARGGGQTRVTTREARIVVRVGVRLGSRVELSLEWSGERSGERVSEVLSVYIYGEKREEEGE